MWLLGDYVGVFKQNYEGLMLDVCSGIKYTIQPLPKSNGKPETGFLK